MQTADVVIIGGGIVGSSIAWHLTEGGCRNVLMVERESHQGKGLDRQEHGRSARAVRDRAQHPDVAVLDSLLRRFRRRWDILRDIAGRAICSLPPGRRIWNICRRTRRAEEAWPATGAHADARGNVATVPQLRADDVLGGSFCPTDGFVDPYSVMVGFITGACEQGAALWRSTAVTAIQRTGWNYRGQTSAAR